MIPFVYGILILTLILTLILVRYAEQLKEVSWVVNDPWAKLHINAKEYLASVLFVQRTPGFDAIRRRVAGWAWVMSAASLVVLLLLATYGQG